MPAWAEVAHVHGQGISQMSATGAMVSLELGCRFLVPVLLSGTAAGAEEVSDGSSDGGGDLFTEFDSNETSLGGQRPAGRGFFPELIDGETLTDIGRLFIFAAVGAVLCTVLYVGTHAWRHDRFCFSHPHPDDERDGMCAVPRDSLSCAASEGTDAMQPKPDRASI